MRFACLGSGSEGNALVVEAGGTRVLLDCGFGLTEVEARLTRLGLSASDLTAILITHEHGDHSGGVMRLAGKYALKVWASYGTLSALGHEHLSSPLVSVLEGHVAFALGELEIAPLPVPHDAREPVQFTFSDGARRLGVLTDLGHITRHVQTSLMGCDALMIECNHDRDMLAAGCYAASLKLRIASRQGHLENAAAANLLASIDTRALQHVIAAHLSKQNNRPELARAALAGALGCQSDWIGVADQALGFEWRTIA